MLPITSVKYELINIPNIAVTYKKAAILWLIEGNVKRTQVKDTIF